MYLIKVLATVAGILAIGVTGCTAFRGTGTFIGKPSATLAQQVQECTTILSVIEDNPGLEAYVLKGENLRKFLISFVAFFQQDAPDADEIGVFMVNGIVILLAAKSGCIWGRADLEVDDFRKILENSNAT